MTPSLSVVIPAYNEEQRLPQTLEAILTYIGRSLSSAAEVLIVDDGSRDRTAGVVESFAREHPYVRLLRNPGNRGKGYSVRHGMLESRGEWRLFTDADLSTPIEEFEKLRAAAERRNADVAIGSRALDRSLIGIRQSAFREYSGRTFNLVMRLTTGLPFADSQCGFKLYRWHAAEQVFARQLLDGFSFDVEDLVIAKRLGLLTIEVPVRWNNAEGTKVSAVQGLRSFSDLMLIRWNDRRGQYK